MNRMNWRKAGLSGKRTLSVADEGEYRSHDAAARWLERKSHFMAAAAKNRDKRKKRKGRAA